MNDKQKLAAAILDSACAEYREENLKSTEAVLAYAYNATNLDIDRIDASEVLKVCREFIALCEDDEGDRDAYYHTVTVPLADD